MASAPIDALGRRHGVVRQFLAREGLDALVVTSLPNILYLTNFSGSSAVAIVTPECLYFITDFRYVAAIEAAGHADRACPDLELVTVSGSYDETLASRLASVGTRVGFEAAHLTVARHQWLESRLRPAWTTGPELVPTTGAVEKIRIRKDLYETTVLREAARRLSVVATEIRSEVHAGRSEREIARAIDWHIGEAGFERPAFDTIVASGPNAALPHASPGERKLTEGDLVVLDFGGVLDSYCADLTRTVSVGRADARSRDIYAAVLDAHDAAIAAVAPGRSRFAVDGAARGLIEHRGFGRSFGHGTGHGLGIEVHEAPHITWRRGEEPPADEAIEPGMVFTIEPGIYVPGWGGVRIEDDVLVTDTGTEVLTVASTELLEL
jgi:Xaa-Pro aminopeptidase